MLRHFEEVARIKYAASQATQPDVIRAQIEIATMENEIANIEGLFTSDVPAWLGGYGPDAENNLVLLSQLMDQVRNTVQEMVDGRLAQRRSAFF